MMLRVQPPVVATLCGEYRSLFDRRSGLLSRYMSHPNAPSPEILEIAIAGPEGQLFELEWLRRILGQAPLCSQVLLTGQPERHRALSSIIRMIHDHGAVPSVVLEGARPTPDVADALKRFAGFACIDVGFDQDRITAVKVLRDLGLRVQLNVPMADATVEWLHDMLTQGHLHQLAQMIVLTGRSCSGAGAMPTGLSRSPALDVVLDDVGKVQVSRLGIDGRLAHVVAEGGAGHPALLARCEAGRCGLFIAHDQTVTPCSMLPGAIVGSLAEQSLTRIWRGHALAEFRREHELGNTPTVVPPCGRIERITAPPASGSRVERADLDLRFGHASSSICDRALPPLSRSQLVQVLAAVRDWKALRFFADEVRKAPVAASWTSLEYFLSLPPIWGHDLARLHEQLVAGTFEGREARVEP
jgi:hypothetical protein